MLLAARDAQLEAERDQRSETLAGEEAVTAEVVKLPPADTVILAENEINNRKITV